MCLLPQPSNHHLITDSRQDQSLALYRSMLPSLWAPQLAPEAVVMMDHSVAAAGGIDALLSIPAFAVTPVAQSRRIVTIEGSYGLGFGPRAAHARYDLALALHPGANLPTLPRRAWV